MEKILQKLALIDSEKFLRLRSFRSYRGRKVIVTPITKTELHSELEIRDFSNGFP